MMQPYNTALNVVKTKEQLEKEIKAFDIGISIQPINFDETYLYFNLFSSYLTDSQIKELEVKSSFFLIKELGRLGKSYHAEFKIPLIRN